MFTGWSSEHFRQIFHRTIPKIIRASLGLFLSDIYMYTHIYIYMYTCSLYIHMYQYNINLDIHNTLCIYNVHVY